jgi:predicted phosphodiesterase
MRVAALYDIHGNLPALEAVVADVRAEGFDLLVIGGDVVPGPMPRECLTLLRGLEVPARFIRGNGDRVVLAARAGEDISNEVPEAFREVVRWNAEKLDDSMAEWMSGWPLTTRIGFGDPGKAVPSEKIQDDSAEAVASNDGHGAASASVLFCHATPRNDSDIFTKLTRADVLQPLFAAVDAALVVCGHTHMQFDRMIGHTRVVNAGSVGMSFQGPGAYWLEIGGGIRLRQTMYDTKAAAAAIRLTSYPQAGAFAEQHVLHPPEEAGMLATFTNVPLKV